MIQNPNTADELERLLAEARKIKGNSLGRDAWRRLRKNKAAMTALVFLFTLSLLAVFTPALPLQSPIMQRFDTRIDGEIDKQHQYVAPNVSRVRLTVTENESEDDGLATAVTDALDKIAEARTALSTSESDDRDAAEEELEQSQRRYEALLNDFWFEPGLFDRALIRLRLAVFDDWAIPSICGTDQLGRDHLARLFYGARVSLIVGVVATLVSLVIGVSWGAVSGYLGGNIDNLMMRLVDVFYSIPFIFLVIFIISIISAEEYKTWLADHSIDQLVVFYILIGAIYWLTMARVVRGQVITLKNEQFVEAARAIGASRARIIFRHLVPNLLSVVIVYLTLTIPSVMLFEAFLSFLGLGVQPPDVSWGQLANEGMKVITPVRIYWWLVVFPGLALALTLFALNIFGDGLRDALDPRLKNR
jgi:oligopeptide transport system permease protein